MPTSLVEDLAWSLVVLGETGLGAVTMRALARHTRVSPGTLTHHFASKNELWALCTLRIGQWFSYATDDYVDDRGTIGLFPEETDETYADGAPGGRAHRDPQAGDVRVTSSSRRPF
jgi:AcrR family transcriptional regulator